MRSLILIVTLLLSWNAQAAPVCARVHAGDQKIDSFHHWRDESDAMFKKQLHGDPQKGQSELYFTWSIWNPIDLQRIDSRSFHRVFSHKRRVVFRNNDDLNSSSPLVRVGKFGATQDYQNEFVLRETYKNYDGRIQDQIIQMILKVEEHIGEVADVRQEMGFVATGEPEYGGGAILGTMRFFNGTPAHSQTPPTFPMEYAFQVRKIPLQTGALLRHLREKYPKLPLYEIGKFSLEGPPESRDRARSLLEMFWLKNYIDRMPEGVFFAHVATKAHLRLYQSRYGFRAVEEIKIPGPPENTEYIIAATGSELRAAFEKLYPLPKIGVSIIPQ